MSRKSSNRDILRILTALVNNHPDQRFMQLLFNADVLKVISDPLSTSSPTVINEYHLESSELLERVRRSEMWQRILGRT